MLRHFLAVIFACAFCATAYSESVITFGHSGGRLGDNLISYLHAKWASYKTGMPLLCNYEQFHYADQFVLYEREHNLRRAHPATYIYINDQYRWPQERDEPTTFHIPYFPESSWEWKENGGYWSRYFVVDFKDPVFRKMALEMIAPRNTIELTLPPPGIKSIAIHARQGGNHEYASPQIDAPLKRPPMSYYRDALKKIIELFPDEPLFCQIFTDAIHPEEVVEIITGDLNPNASLTVHYRQSGNSDSSNVIEDFFSLFHYDILIRPESNFSMVPSLLHDFDLVIIPTHASYTPNGIVIDQMKVVPKNG